MILVDLFSIKIYINTKHQFKILYQLIKLILIHICKS